MNRKALAMASAVILFAVSSMLAQQKKQPTTPPKSQQPHPQGDMLDQVADSYAQTDQVAPDASLPDKPKACVEFDGMASRIEAVETIEEITADEFAAAAAQPKVIIRDPGRVFDLGNLEYIAQETGGKTTYRKFTTHKDKESEFMKWYNHGGQGEMTYAAVSCSFQYINQILDSRDKRVQHDLLFQQTLMWMSFSQATSIARVADDEMFRSALEWGSAGFQETMRLKDRYNKLVENVNAYNDAVNNLISTVDGILKTQRSSRPVPAINFNFVRPQPITCTGNTLAFSNSTAYFNNLDTVTNATTTIQCQ